MFKIIFMSCIRTQRHASGIAMAGAADVAGNAQDFSKGSKAEKWGLIDEKKALFSGKVVDMLV